MRSSQVHDALVQSHHDVSLVTVKRLLSIMARAGFVAPSGAGRSTTYTVAVAGRLFLDLDAKQYCAMDPDDRYGLSGFNFDLLKEMPSELFTHAELQLLKGATQECKRRTKNVSETIAKKERERLMVELSWKSSKIEGNTYTLLDTERLLLEHREAPGHSPHEARMILNHQDAFTLIHENAQDFRTLTRANLEHLHGKIVKGLSVGKGLRRWPVGVTGSRYQPIDNVHQITDAIQSLSIAVRRMQSPYAKALLALLGISYIQPFEDGNKRTARLMANALLLAHDCTPLSYRSVNENAYREATLVFYEINSVVPFKQIFIEQYIFAASHYALR